MKQLFARQQPSPCSLRKGKGKAKLKWVLYKSTYTGGLERIPYLGEHPQYMLVVLSFYVVGVVFPSSIVWRTLIAL